MTYGIEKESHLGGYLITNNIYGDPGTWGPEIWDKIICDYNIKSVLDIGCGKGYSTRYFSQKGLQALGIEGGSNAVKNSVHNNIKQVDYTSGALNSEQSFDLIWCCEFVEHVEEKYTKNFLVDFNRGAYIAMTFAIPGQDGYHHVNLQNQEYWIDRIKDMGYSYMKEYTAQLREIANKLNQSTTFPHSGHLTKILFFRRNANIFR